MKKITAILLSLLLSVNASFALTNNHIPDEFTITERWVSLTTTFDVETKTEKLGTLYRKIFSLALTYEFIDPYNHLLATARAAFFSLTAHFDVYDVNNELIGVAEEKFFSFYPTFDIYGKDGVTKLAYAQMNFWNTAYSIYDPATGIEMAEMRRPYFRLKNDWTFKIFDRHLLMKKNIDPRVLLTVIAFTCDREYWQSQYNLKSVATQSQQVKTIKEKINSVSNAEINSKILDEKTLASVASELERDYKNNEQIDFVDYCLNLIKMKAVSDEKKQAILQLLKLRVANKI